MALLFAIAVPARGENTAVIIVDLQSSFLEGQKASHIADLLKANERLLDWGETEIYVGRLA